MPEIQLAAEDERFIEEQVEAGIYRNADEAVAAGLRLLGSKEGKLQELRTFIQEGIDDVEAGHVMSFESEGELTAYILGMPEDSEDATTPTGAYQKRSSRSPRAL